MDQYYQSRQTMASPNFQIPKASQRSTLASNRESIIHKLSQRDQEILNDFQRRVSESANRSSHHLTSNRSSINQINLNEESTLGMQNSNREQMVLQASSIGGGGCLTTYDPTQVNTIEKERVASIYSSQRKCITENNQQLVLPKSSARSKEDEQYEKKSSYRSNQDRSSKQIRFQDELDQAQILKEEQAVQTSNREYTSKVQDDVSYQSKYQSIEEQPYHTKLIGERCRSQALYSTKQSSKSQIQVYKAPSNLTKYQKLFLEGPKQKKVLGNHKLQDSGCSHTLSTQKDEENDSKCCQNRDLLEHQFDQNTAKKRQKTRLDILNKSLNQFIPKQTQAQRVKPLRQSSLKQQQGRPALNDVMKAQTLQDKNFIFIVFMKQTGQSWH